MNLYEQNERKINYFLERRFEAPRGQSRIVHIYYSCKEKRRK